MSVVALATVEQVKQYLSISNTVDDALFERLVDSASAFVQSWLSRTFGIETYTDVFDGTGRQVYIFRNYPALSVASLTIDGQPIPASGGAFEAGYRADAARLVLIGHTFASGLMNCSVTYSAGYEAVPDDINQATIEIIAHRYREKDRIGLTSKGLAGETTAFSQRDMPQSARATLNLYRKVVPN